MPLRGRSARPRRARPRRRRRAAPRGARPPRRSSPSGRRRPRRRTRLAGEADPGEVGDLIGNGALGELERHQVGAQMHDERGLAPAAVDAEAAFVGTVDPVAGGNRHVDEEGAKPVQTAKLPQRHLQQRHVAAVPVVEHERLRGGVGDRGADLAQGGEQGVGADPGGAGSPVVLVRLGVGQRGHPPDVQARLDGGIHHAGGHLVGHQQVGDERQVGAVMLDRADGQHDDRVGGEGGRKCRAGELGEFARAAAHSWLPVATGAARCSLPGLSSPCGSVVSASSAVRTGS